MLKTSLLNIILRGSSLASKFMLLLAVARYLVPADVGIYGLFTGTVAIAVYVLGLDFYIYNTREILARDEAGRIPLIRDQLVFYLLTYAVTLPLLLAVFLGGVIPWRYAALFYGVLVFEHLSQEAYRLLIVLSRPVKANVVLFLRTGAWIGPALVMVVLTDAGRGIGLVLGAWMLGAATSVALAAWYLSDLNWSSCRGTPIAWRAMRNTAIGALPFLAGTLALRGVEYTDRYFVEHYSGAAMVGVYTFYKSIANVVQTFTLAGVIEVLYPRAVEAFQTGQRSTYQMLMKRMALGSVITAAIGSLLVASGLPLMLRVVNRPLYAASSGLSWVLLASVVVGIVAWLPYYALYARRRDLSLLMANVAGLAVSLSANALLVPRFGVYGAGIASLLASCAIGLFTTVALLSAPRHEYATAKREYLRST